MHDYEITATYDCRVYNGSAYADYAGRTRHRILRAESMDDALATVLRELAQVPDGAGERVTAITALRAERGGRQ